MHCNHIVLTGTHHNVHKQQSRVSHSGFPRMGVDDQSFPLTDPSEVCLTMPGYTKRISSHCAVAACCNIQPVWQRFHAAATRYNRYGAHCHAATEFRVTIESHWVSS